MAIALMTSQKLESRSRKINHTFPFSQISTFSCSVITLAATVSRLFSSSSSSSGEPITIPGATADEWKEFFSEGIFSILFNLFAKKISREDFEEDDVTVQILASLGNALQVGDKMSSYNCNFRISIWVAA